jgi:catechol 2,3-dioxygenase-like lactoylglutathione lyase family enzyme
MKFRVARHTTNLQALIDFYTQNLDLEVLGSFENHSNYDGVFLGKKGLDWHLEFTISPDLPIHQADEDDLLVFYTETLAEFNHIKANFDWHQQAPIAAKNPYWEQHALTYLDPDGFRVVVVSPV